MTRNERDSAIIADLLMRFVVMIEFQPEDVVTKVFDYLKAEMNESSTMKNFVLSAEAFVGQHRAEQ